MRISTTKAMASSSLGRALERLVQTSLGVRVDRLNLGGISYQRSAHGREKLQPSTISASPGTRPSPPAINGQEHYGALLPLVLLHPSAAVLLPGWTQFLLYIFHIRY